MPIYLWSIQIIPQKQQTWRINDQGNDDGAEDVTIHMMNCCNYIQKLEDNKRSESDCDYSHKRLLKEIDCQYHDD